MPIDTPAHNRVPDATQPPRPGNIRVALILFAAVIALDLLLTAPYDPTDGHQYLSGAYKLFHGEAVDPRNVAHHRLGMIGLTGSFMSMFGWALWARNLFTAFSSGVAAVLIFLAIRRFIPMLPSLFAALVPLSIPGLLRWGTGVAPDAPQTALLTAGLLLLFRPGYRMPGRAAALGAGLLWAAMLSVNPAGLRFGASIVAVGAWWLWRIERNERAVFLKRIGLVFFGTLLGLAAVALLQRVLHDDPWLLWRALLAEFAADPTVSMSDAVDGGWALRTWLLGTLGPFGEFGLLLGVAAIGVWKGRKRVEAGGMALATILFCASFGVLAAHILPGVLAGKPVFGEIQTRYMLPAALGMAIPVAALCAYVRDGWPRVTLTSACLLFSGATLLTGHWPAYLTPRPEHILSDYREYDGKLYASKRLARYLGVMWRREVYRLEDIDGEGIAIVSPREAAFVKRKYGVEGVHLPDGFTLAEESLLIREEAGLWLRAGNIVRALKDILLFRPSTRMRYSEIYRVHRILKENDDANR